MKLYFVNKATSEEKVKTTRDDFQHAYTVLCEQAKYWPEFTLVKALNSKGMNMTTRLLKYAQRRQMQ